MGSRNQSGISNAWTIGFGSRWFIAEALFTLAAFIGSIRVCSVMLNYIDVRKGVPLADPILSRVGPIDLTWFTFTMLWPSIGLGLYYLLDTPRRFLMGLQAVSLIMAFRTMTLFLTPLEPLPTIIPLADPLIVHLGTGNLIIKDLFFSGHTSIMFLLFLSANRRWLRRLFLLGTIGVAVCVAVQHVHYSVDVFSAPFFAYASWRIPVVIHEKLRATTP
jgi:hypothetical protein